MSSREGEWDKIIKNIEFISTRSYTTVGVVLTQDNIREAEKIILLAHQLGVSDIRVIPSAQYNEKLSLEIPDEIINAHQILQYRLRNSNRHVRGLRRNDSRKCRLVLDDMAVWNSCHYPCIIYLREYGTPIGIINHNARKERYDWYDQHNSWDDNICRKNCLDVCIEYNNEASKYD
jgi:MoaA/NifB/PqqE/SkfB family radical SAM enzyme